MGLNEDIEQRRLVQIERRLNEVGSMVRGNQAFQADRIADVIEQIDEVRKELRAVAARVDRMAKFLTKLASKDNGQKVDDAY